MLITKNTNVNSRLWASLQKKRLQTRVQTSPCKQTHVVLRQLSAFRCINLPLLKHKIFYSATQVIEDIFNGSHILVGGFGLCGLPETLLRELAKSDLKDLTLVCADAGTEDSALSMLLKKKQVKRITTSWARSNHLLEELYLKGDIEVRMIPQGTLAERLRAGGSGIPAFYTAVGAGTLVEEGGLPVKYIEGGGYVEVQSSGRETREFHGKSFILEEAIKGHFALIRAWRADEVGNLCFRKTACNFNVPMSKAARVVIAEVDEIMKEGAIPPEAIQIPGIYVDRIICRKASGPKVESVAMKRPETGDSVLCCTPAARQRDRIARRAAIELRHGMCINLGPGIPMHLAEFIPRNMNVILHSESGILGMGPYPNTRQEIDPDLINSCKQPVTEMPGVCYVSCDEAYAMVTGGHIDMILIDAMEVSQYGDVANWTSLPDASHPELHEIGSAMDLVAARRENTLIIVTTTHVDPNGRDKIVETCSLPLTGQRCVDLIITDMAVFKVHPEEGLTLIEKAEDISIEDIVSHTACEFQHTEKIKPMMQIKEAEPEER